jgi:transketolase N-terminal domain/subunit
MKLVRTVFIGSGTIGSHNTAGHRVATQYILSALEGAIPPEHLFHYREANSKLPGHPELGLTPGVKFSSGRLGHMWPLVNGLALANKDKTIFCLGSDGSQQEGNDAEAARLAVARGLNVKLLIGTCFFSPCVGCIC